MDRAVLDDRPEVIAGAVVTMQRCVLNFARFVCDSFMSSSSAVAARQPTNSSSSPKSSASRTSTSTATSSTSCAASGPSVLESVAIALLAASTHPAELLGLAPRLGTLRFGATADLVVLDFDERLGLEAPNALQVLATFVGGKCVYVKDEQTRVRLNIPSKLIVAPS